MSVAKVLDPQYKMGWVNYAFPKIFGDDIAPKKIEEVKKFCFDLYQEYKLKNERPLVKTNVSSPLQTYVELEKWPRSAIEDNLARIDEFFGM